MPAKLINNQTNPHHEREESPLASQLPVWDLMPTHPLLARGASLSKTQYLPIPSTAKLPPK